MALPQRSLLLPFLSLLPSLFSTFPLILLPSIGDKVLLRLLTCHYDTDSSNSWVIAFSPLIEYSGPLLHIWAFTFHISVACCCTANTGSSRQIQESWRWDFNPEKVNSPLTWHHNHSSHHIGIIFLPHHRKRGEYSIGRYFERKTTFTQLLL